MPYRVSVESRQAAEPRVDSTQLDALQRVILTIDRGDTLHGLVALECEPELREIATAKSYLGYCMARERGHVRDALQLCRSALAVEPRNPAHYLNLGRVFLQAGDKAKAIATFWKGISMAPGVERGVAADSPQHGHGREHELILEQLRRLGIRKKVPFTSLRRGHPLNRIAGKLLASVGIR